MKFMSALQRIFDRLLDEDDWLRSVNPAPEFVVTVERGQVKKIEKVKKKHSKKKETFHYFDSPCDVIPQGDKEQ